MLLFLNKSLVVNNIKIIIFKCVNTCKLLDSCFVDAAVTFFFCSYFKVRMLHQEIQTLFERKIFKIN